MQYVSQVLLLNCHVRQMKTGKQNAVFICVFGTVVSSKAVRVEQSFHVKLSSHFHYGFVFISYNLT